MDKSEIAIQCTKCESINVSKGSPKHNIKENTFSQTLKCNDCGHEIEDEI